MTKQNRGAELALLGCIGSIILAILLLVVYVFTSSNASLELLNVFLSMASFLLIILSAFLYLLAFVLFGWEIATAKNDVGWKALWLGILLVSLLFAGAGMFIYWFFGRSSLKD